MNKQYRMFFAVFAFVFFSILLVFSNGYAQLPVVKIELEPDIQVIYIGDPEKQNIDLKDGVLIMVDYTDSRLKFEWSLDGPGKLDGNKTESAIFYVPPTEISERSTEATVVLTVTDHQERTTTLQEKFTIIQPPVIPTPTPTPTPSFGIRQVLLTDTGGTIMNPTYFISPGETVTIDVKVTESAAPDAKIECTAIRGKVELVQEEITYTAPNNPESRDMITIKATDKEGAIVQTIIKIQIKD